MAIKNKTEAIIAIELFKSMVRKCTRKEVPLDQKKCIEVLLNSNAYKLVEITSYDHIGNGRKYTALKFGDGNLLCRDGYYTGSCYGYDDEESWVTGVRKATCISELIQLFPAFVHAH